MIFMSLWFIFFGDVYRLGFKSVTYSLINDMILSKHILSVDKFIAEPDFYIIKL